MLNPWHTLYSLACGNENLTTTRSYLPVVNSYFQDIFACINLVSKLGAVGKGFQLKAGGYGL